MALRTINLRPNPKPKKISVKRKKPRRRKSVRRRKAKPASGQSGASSKFIIQGVSTIGALYWRHGKWVVDPRKAERFSREAAIEQKERIVHNVRLHPNRRTVLLQVIRA